MCVSKLNSFIMSCSFFIVVCVDFFPLVLKSFLFVRSFPYTLTHSANPLRSLSRVLKLPLHVKHRRSLGPDPTGTGTMSLDPTFGSFALLEPVSHLVKVFRLFRLERIVLVFRVWTQSVVVHYWQGQGVCDALAFKL